MAPVGFSDDESDIEMDWRHHRAKREFFKCLKTGGHVYSCTIYDKAGVFWECDKCHFRTGNPPDWYLDQE